MNSNRVYIGACVIALAGILFWVLVLPTYDTIMAQRVALEERDVLLADRGKIIANINAHAQQYAEHSADIQRFSSIVPAQKSVPEIVSALERLASQNGLQLTSLSLGSNTNQGKELLYQTQSVDMGLAGSYPSFKSFLQALERNIRIIDVISIDASPTSDTSPIIGFRLKGNAYYLK